MIHLPPNLIHVINVKVIRKGGNVCNGEVFLLLLVWCHVVAPELSVNE